MVVPLIIAGVLAVAFLGLWVMTQQKLGGVRGELSETETQLASAKSEVASVTETLDFTKSEVASLEAKSSRLSTELEGTSARLTDANDTLRKRTELADAQALQIDALSGERDDLREEIRQAEEKVAAMATRPGFVVGDIVDGADPDGPGGSSSAEGGSQFETLWNLELARTDRLWRNSVAIDPTSEASPLDDAENQLRQAIEIEAAALREDVGALIDVDWRAEPVSTPARRLVVLRLAQEMLASAARAPGATTLVVTDEAPDPESGDSASGGGSGLRLEFTSAGSSDESANLIPPAVTGPAFGGVLDIRREGAAAVVLATGRIEQAAVDSAASSSKA